MAEQPEERKADPRTIYVGNLPPDCKDEDLRNEFQKFGELKSIDCKSRYAFLEFEEVESAEEALKNMNGAYFGSERIYVQPHKPGAGGQRRVGGMGGGMGGGGGPGGRRPGPGGRDQRTEFRVVIFNLDERASWQDLKDFGRTVGEVNFTNVFTRSGKKIGVIEYFAAEAMRRAVEELHGRKLYDRRLHVEQDRGQMVPLVPIEFAGESPPSDRRGRGGYDYRGGGTPYPPVIRAPVYGTPPVLIPPPGARQRSRSRGPPGYCYGDVGSRYGGRGRREEEFDDGMYGKDYRAQPPRYPSAGRRTPPPTSRYPRSGMDAGTMRGEERRGGGGERSSRYYGSGGGYTNGTPQWTEGGKDYRYAEMMAMRGSGGREPKTSGVESYSRNERSEREGEGGEGEHYERRHHRGAVKDYYVSSSRAEREEGRGRERREKVYEEAPRSSKRHAGGGSREGEFSVERKARYGEEEHRTSGKEAEGDYRGTTKRASGTTPIYTKGSSHRESTRQVGIVRMASC
eukprot:GHVQ01004501.1.p1 GENE.GHVQ01004501.1~~GHVQ01004501.1.p1  ORF type:complete len:513 (+),score=93.42 GHVQ01004501.1:168-1706(+)